MKAFIAVCFVALVLGQDVASGTPLATTQLGKVQGTTGESRNGRTFYSFRGIPYAKAERFQPPVVADKWEDVKDVTGPAKGCIRYNPFAREILGEEKDCLNVNVFTPKLPKEGEDKILLPVIVYLHPGLNNDGSNENFQPNYFMDEDVVLVIPNFRLGVFGFLSTHDKNAQGNMGLRDQVLALKWVKENIEQFGGDSGRVTVMGSGSGGEDAFLHTLAPPSKGLFHNIISMGGTTVSRIGFILNPVKQAKKLGTQIGCPVDNSDALVSCLKGKDAKEILEKMTKLDPKAFNVHEFAWFGPVVEKVLEGQTEDDLIVSDNPIKLLKEGKIVNKVPMILGGNEQEGINIITAALLKEKPLMDKLDKEWMDLAPNLLVYKDTAKDKDVVSAKIREFYFKDKPISEETFAELCNVFMDRFMGLGIVITSQLYSKSAPVYLYYFSHIPETSGLKFLGVDKSLGMAHLDDLQFLFKLNMKKFKFPEITKDSKEYQLSQNLVKLIGSFAENGKPTKVWGEGKEWKRMEAGDPSKWYKIGEETFTHETAPEQFQARIGFQVELFNKELSKEKETPVGDEF